VLALIPAGIALGMVHGPALAPALATWLTALTGLELGGLVPTAAVQVQGAVLVGGLCGGGLPALVAVARRASIVGTSGASPCLTPF
jgi:hypothetical protein